MFFAMGGGVMIGGRRFIIRLTCVCLVDEVTPLLASGNHAIDGTPVGQSTHIAVIDEKVGLQLTGEVRIVLGRLFWIVAIGGIELHATFPTPIDGIVQQLSLAT